MVEHLVEAQSVLGSSPNLSTTRLSLWGKTTVSKTVEGSSNLSALTKYLNIVFNGSTSALGAFRVGSSPAIQTREVVKLFHHYSYKSNAFRYQSTYRVDIK